SSEIVPSRSMKTAGCFIRIITRLSRTNSLQFWRNCRASTTHASAQTLHQLRSPSCNDDRSGNHATCTAHNQADVSERPPPARTVWWLEDLSDQRSRLLDVRA